MFETSFSESSANPIPPNLSIENAVTILHDFDTVIRFSPDCRGSKPVPPPKGKSATTKDCADGWKQQYYEVEDALPFIPKRLWSGGVRYTAVFMPVADGCDITIYAPGGFTSTNRWRLLRDHIPEDGETTLERAKSKDLLHADEAGSGWYVQIVSDAVCSRTYAGFVKGYLRNSHVQLRESFVEKLRASSRAARKDQSRPQLGRRKSSAL